MVNDVNNLNGALQELGETLSDNLVAMGVSASASDGLTTLANKITDISPSVGGLDLDISIDLSNNPHTPYIHDNVLLNAKVNADYDTTAIDVDGVLQGATVTFKNGSTTLGTSVTGLDGIATYTINDISIGTYNITASFDGSGTDYDSATGALTFTVGHNYSLAFSQTSIIASLGSATIECTLLDNGEAVSGATVTLTGTDNSTYTSTTNANGVASFNITVTGNATFTATYNTTTTATIDVIYTPYQAVEYLQSTGSQYINTGYILKAHDTVEVTVSTQGRNTYEAVWGARKSNASNKAFGLFNRFASNDIFTYFRTGLESSGSGISRDTIYKAVSKDNHTSYYLNDELVQTITCNGTIEDCVNPCGLFCINTSSGTGFSKDTYGYMKIYDFKITSSDETIQLHMIPVRNGTVGGMYDIISKNFYNTSGTFRYGADI